MDLGVVDIEKVTFGSPSTMVSNFTYYRKENLKEEFKFYPNLLLFEDPLQLSVDLSS